MFSNRRNTDLIYTVLYLQNITKRSKSKNGKEVKRIYLLSFVEAPRKFIIAELSIRKLGSSSVL